jgi:hypothetical protein
MDVGHLQLCLEDGGEVEVAVQQRADGVQAVTTLGPVTVQRLTPT